ncbi:unnamed protein product [Peronospora belbahrii]|uniref:Uncharacterized protein n=1 Tax=Peronospora belbahrii TaxID=622444 RepID=A0AAU9L042_9STRA|nr:unnamed protein product [Peronospora belbahrii]CAH0516492.1 unnamed protein product [Peronospora belbahrii]
MKNVRWSTVTVYEFGVGLGGSAVPKLGGPSVGLAWKPRCIWSTSLDNTVRTEYDKVEEDEKALAVVRTMKSDGKKDRAKHKPRRRKVRWIKPQERITMLTKAGCSEKRIYRMMMESSEIAMSRRLTLRILDI